MKLYFSPASPFVRKVMVTAIELGLDKKIEQLDCNVHVINRDATVVSNNPLGQVPTLIADDGTCFFDSRVICEYLDFLGGSPRIFPAAGPARWQAIIDQSLADGLLDAALLGRQELTIRPAEKAWEPWRLAQIQKITDALDRMQAGVKSLGARVDIGTITVACSLGYLDFRYPDFDWRGGRGALADWFATFAERPSFVATTPKNAKPR